MKQRIAAITLGVTDFQRSLKFYSEGLGWKRSGGDATGDIAFFQLGGVVLAIYPRHSLAEDATVESEGTGFKGFTLSHNVASEAEADEVLRLAEKAGAAILKPAQKVFWGGYSGYFADPDGFLWEVAFNPFWPIDEEGNVTLPD